MDRSDSEFGDLEEGDLIHAATGSEQATSSAEFCPARSHQISVKGTRLHGSEDAILEDSSQVSQSLFVSQSIADDVYSEEDVEELPETPDQKKRKLKAHIPKHDTLFENAFCTQIPQSSDSPYRIRGPIWQKAQPQTQSAGQTAHVSEVTVLQERNEFQQNIVSHSVAPPGKSSVIVTSISRNRALSDDFDMSDEEGFEIMLDRSLQNSHQPSEKEKPAAPRLAGPLKNLKQTTLFGTQSVETINAEAQSTRRYNWPLANKQEIPTHHKLVPAEIVTWVYPTNLGTIREYQFNIVARGLYHNLLVALPTGLGKTFIAATIMLNWFRWTANAQIVFVAPTKPLVSQQVDACFKIAGIPRSATTMLTGGIQPGVRAEEWISKRVFFMTPQTFINDLKTGICDPKRIVLLVVDEAHRATGGYAYVEVVNFLRRFNPSFRVLALTATPGASVESVQSVIDGLGISKVEIRTEESLDIRQYVHPRKIVKIEFDPSEEMLWIYENLSKALQPLVDLMRRKNAYWSKDPMSLTAFGCNKAREAWMSSDAGRKASQGEKYQVMIVFTILASLGHSIELLKNHGITPFYHKLKTFRDDEKGGKYAKQIKEHQSFNDILARLRLWVVSPDFIGHPKLDHLQGTVLEHFVSASEGRHVDPDVSPNKTRVMIFAHFRDSAEEIVRVLNRNDPMIRAHVFVGQASASGSDGMNQKKQLEVIEQFRKGIYNTLVATSIGEEGLDIGEVDLIICYDSSASPIRMLQRMGRTGRKRAGEIVVLLMKGKETNSFDKARDNYEKMQLMIADGQRFTYHDDLSPRIVPKEIQPIVDKRIVEIPQENSQADLPEPKKRGRPPKRPPKKFNMPDGVETGFVAASRLGDDQGHRDMQDHAAPTKITQSTTSMKRNKVVQAGDSAVPKPSLASVLLSMSEEEELDRNYLQIAGDSAETVEMPRLDTYPVLQRSARPIGQIGHGRNTERLQHTLRRMNSTTMSSISKFEANLNVEDTKTATRRRSSQKKVSARNTEKVNAETVLRSPLSTPTRQTDTSSTRFWISPEKPSMEIEASQDLPDLETMLGRTPNVPQKHVGKATRKRKIILDSDSDD